MGFPLILLSQAPSIWGPILAGLGSTALGSFLNSRGTRQRGPDLEELRRRALAELDPTRISQEAGRQELELLNSPGTHAMRSQLIQAGQMGTNAINQRLAQTGLGRSGVGMALESGVRAAPGIQDAMLTSQLLATARDRALQMQKMRADAQMAGGMMPDRPDYMTQMLGAFTGALMGPAMEAAFGKGKATTAPTSEELQASAKNNILNGTARMRAYSDVSPYSNSNSSARPFSSIRNLPGFPKQPKLPNVYRQMGSRNPYQQPFEALGLENGFMPTPRLPGFQFPGFGNPYSFGRLF